MKKAIALLMAALMTLGLCGCSLKDFTKTLTLTEPEEVTEAFFNGLKTNGSLTLHYHPISSIYSHKRCKCFLSPLNFF